MSDADLVTTEQAAGLLDVKASTIASWKHRRRIIPAGYLAGRGRGGMVPLYRLEELQPLADQHHQRTSTRRIQPEAGQVSAQ